MKFCQCCGMPMEGANYGKEKDGTLSEDYCEYCYHNTCNYIYTKIHIKEEIKHEDI